MILTMVGIAVMLSGGAVMLRAKQSRLLKGLLAVLYVVTAAVMINTYNAAVTADQKGLAGNAVGWFGPAWVYVLTGLVVTVLVLHVVAFMRSKTPK
jgi:hypothetical protein